MLGEDAIGFAVQVEGKGKERKKRNRGGEALIRDRERKEQFVIGGKARLCCLFCLTKGKERRTTIAKWEGTQSAKNAGFAGFAFQCFITADWPRLS